MLSITPVTFAIVNSQRPSTTSFEDSWKKCPEGFGLPAISQLGKPLMWPRPLTLPPVISGTRHPPRMPDSFSLLTSRFDFHYLYRDWPKHDPDLERSGNRHGCTNA